MRVKSAAISGLEGMKLVGAVLWEPQRAMARAVRGRHAFIAWMVWLGSWAVHWPIVLRDDLSGSNYDTHVPGAIAFAVILMVVNTLIGSMMLGILSVVMTPYDMDFDGRDVRIVLGYSAAPHLLLGALMTWGGIEAFGPTYITALPGGAGIAATVAIAIWVTLGGSRELNILWYLAPAVLNALSGVLAVEGMSNISGVDRRKIARSFAGVIALSAFLCTFIMLPLSVFVYALSFGP